MLSPKSAKAVFEKSPTEKRHVGTSARREKDVLSAEDIKQSKDRINALRNSFPFYGRGFQGDPLVGGVLVDDVDEQDVPRKEGTYSRKLPDEDDEEEKEKCEGGSDSETCPDEPGFGRRRSIVQGRIASYELPYKGSPSPRPRNHPSGPLQENQRSDEGNQCGNSSSRTILPHRTIVCNQAYQPTCTNKESKKRTIVCNQAYQPTCTNKESQKRTIVCNQAYQPTCTNKESQKLWSLKERYQNSVTNLTYEGYDFGLGNDELIDQDNEFNDDLDNNRMITKVNNDFPRLKSNPISKTSVPTSSTSSKPFSRNNLIYQLKSEIDNLSSQSSEGVKTEPSNVIFGNKDILKLLSNKHLANLNIRVERNADFRKDNKWRDTFRAKPGLRASFRSSKRKRKCKYKAIHPSSEEKGTSDSTLKENESSSDSGEELKERLHQRGTRLRPESDEEKEKSSSFGQYSTGEYVKKKFPEYAKVNKRKGGIAPGVSPTSDIPPRSLSTSPIERAPVVKKICSSGVRLKKDSEPSLMANPVKKMDSFRGSKVTRRHSFLYNTKGKSTPREGIEHQDSFVKTQATRLRRKTSKGAKKSEYRVSVTIRPSTVANLANKFNTIILQNQEESGGVGNQQQQHTQQKISTDVDLGKVSLLDTPTKVPTRYYSSPRASFKRKYRHKASRVAKETKEKERLNAEKELLQVEKGQVVGGIDNTIYYTDNTAPKRRSLNNSLPELNMKDLFEDADYNKTDEEKVCEKLKTALSSAKFKGETDDSEDDLASKPNENSLGNEEKVSTADKEEDVVPSSTHISTEDKDPHQTVSTSETSSSSASVKDEKESEHRKDDLTKVEDKAESTNEKTDRENGRDGNGHSKSDSVDSGISTDGGKENQEQQSCPPEESSEIPSVVGLEVQRDDGENLVEEDTPLSQEGDWKVDDINELSEKKSLGKIAEINEAINTFLFVDNLLYAKADTLHLLCKDEDEEPDADKVAAADDVKMEAPSNVDKEETPETAVAETKNEETGKEESPPVGDAVGEVDELTQLRQQQTPDPLMEDSYSEVSSINSDLKGKGKAKGESSIYTSLKAVVKNTVRKTKEKDTEIRKNDAKDGAKSRHRKRSPSRERDKWYKRNRSKERKAEKSTLSEFQPAKGKHIKKQKQQQKKQRLVEEEKHVEQDQQNTKEKTGKKEGGVRLYEKWGFKRFRDKSEERSKENTETLSEKKDTTGSGKSVTTAAVITQGDAISMAASEKDHPSTPTLVLEDDLQQQSSSSKSGEGEDEEHLYGKVKVTSRSRSREKRDAKNLISVSTGGQKKKPPGKQAAVKDSKPINNISDETSASETPTAKLDASVSPLLELPTKEDVSHTSKLLPSSKPAPLSKIPTSSELTPLTDSPQLPKEKRDEELSIYEPHSPTGVKVIPPPPKTPIPSPPKTFKKFFLRHKFSKGSSSRASPKEEAATDAAAENIYENIYSPDVETLKKNRQRLEEEGIKPISSFLWSESAILLAKASKEANKMPSGSTKMAAKAGRAGILPDKEEENIYGECSRRSNTLPLTDTTRGKSPVTRGATLTKLKTRRDDDEDEDEQSLVRYDKIASPLPPLILEPPSKLPSSSKYEEGSSPGGSHHNYTEIQNNSSGDSQTLLTYDDIGVCGSSAVCYDEIAAPSSSTCSGYDDIQPPSVHECYDPYKTPSEGYDPVNPPQPKSDSSQYDDCGGGGGAAVITHSPRGKDDQVDTLSYVYDDISMYNASQMSHSYEPVCPPGTTGSQYPSSLVPPALDASRQVKETLGKAASTVSLEENKTTEVLYESDGSENSPHEVFSYKLTKIGAGTDSPQCPTKLVDLSKKETHQSAENAPGKKKKTSKRRQEKVLGSSKVDEVEGDSWEDVSDSEEENDIPVTLTTKLPFYRKECRPKKTPRNKNLIKKSWTQGVRDVASAHNSRFHAHVLSSSLAKVNPHAHGRAHITPTKVHPTHGRGGSDRVITYSWRQRPRTLDGALRWTPPNGIPLGSSPPPCPPRPLKPPPSLSSSSSFSSSASHSSHSSANSSSSCSSHISPSSSRSSCALSLPPNDLKENPDEDQVYVTSSSTIIIVNADDDSNIYDAAYESTYYNASNVSSYGTPSECHSAKMRSIFYEDVNECQEISCYVEGPDSECEEESPGHYEAIYEVISPADEEDNKVDQNPAESDHKDDLKYDLKDDLKDDYLQCPPDDPELDDSFDSDDSDEAYTRLRPQFTDPTALSCLQREGLRPLSMDAATLDSKKYIRRKYNRSYSYQPQQHGINKLAEAANLGMKRLRRNWSLTKNEVRTGLNRIKKKSTFSMSDMKSTEDIFSEVGASSSDKSKWSFKSHFRRKSTSTLPAPLTTPLYEEGTPGSRRGSKDNATFYLTLTIASEEQQDAPPEEGSEGGGGGNVGGGSSLPSVKDERQRKSSITPSVSSTASSSCETSKPRPISAPVPCLYRNSSTGSNSGVLFRPTNPPPAPPSGATSPDADDESSTDMSKDRLASRLNQILSAGPVLPPGRRVLRTSESCSSTDVSPIPLLPTSEDKQPNKPTPSHISSLKGAPSLRQIFSAPEVGAASASPPLVAPRNRGSVASSSSHGSSEGYIRFNDIATAPPPLPARPASSSYPPLRRVSTGSVTGPQSPSSPPAGTQTLLRSPSKTSSIESDSKSYLELNYEAQGGDDPPYVSSHFADEPLYQFYTAKVERAALYQGDSSEDDYEVINDGGALIESMKGGPRPTAMELVTPTDGRRTLWCELAEVTSSGILNKITSQERKLQEAMFEVITSEASYLKSLEVLVSHFMNCPEFSREEDPVLSRRDLNVLFSDILPVKKCSELFLGDLEKRWQESVYISGITDIILKHATSSFNVYVKYCSNQIYQDRKLRNLKENNPRFVEVLYRLETAPVCQSLAMQSFLMLPMQRVTRLPLLIDAIFNRLEYGSSQWQECKIALASLQKIVTECNEAARKMERMEEMLLISHQLDFREVKAIPLISASRWLVKKGELTRLTWREGDNKLTFGRKISKHALYFFLFTDLLVVTKKKSDDQHMVLDYCPRNMVQVLELESADKFPVRILDGHKNLIIMTMLQNHENKTVEMVLSCPLESDRTRWMEAVTPRISENPDERIYEEWDCPQVQAIHAYAAQQPDELSLEVSDVFNVLKKTSDGFYQGERLRDGARGWFPGNHTAEIASAHVRARNLRKRYRMLAISGSIVDELKKEKERFEKEEKKKDRRKTITIKEVL